MGWVHNDDIMTSTVVGELARTVPHITASATPLWDEIVTVVNDSIRTAAVIIGGVIGYVKFLNPSLALSLKSEIIHVAGNPAMEITATIKNDGRFRISFLLGTSQLIIIQAADEVLWEAAKYGEILWSEGEVKQFEILQFEGAVPRLRAKTEREAG
jgi:hypothetical protein